MFENMTELEAKEQILKYSKEFQGTLNDKECIKLIGISRGSYYKYKREISKNINKFVSKLDDENKNLIKGRKYNE